MCTASCQQYNKQYEQHQYHQVLFSEFSYSTILENEPPHRVLGSQENGCKKDREQGARGQKWQGAGSMRAKNNRI